MEEKRVKKSFFSSVKECAWLNAMGQKGYRLTYRGDGKYYFEIEEGKNWYYSVEWLDCSPESVQGQAYIQSRAEEGAELATTYSLWAYFLSASPIPARPEGQKRTAVHYRNVALLLYLLDAITAVLIGYHFVIRDFLQEQSVFLQAPELKKSGAFLVDIARRLVFGAKELLYRYGMLWGKLFGNTKAALVLGILIPLAVVLSVMGAFWTVEWLKNKPAKTAVKAEQEGDSAADEQSEVSGEA